MTKKELIEALDQFPENWKVIIVTEDRKPIKKYENYNINKVYGYDEGEIGVELETN